MKTNSRILQNFVAACGLLCGLSAAYGAVVIESFESGTLNGWNPGTLNGSVTGVNTDRATDGIYSAANSFSVPSTFAGYTTVSIIDKDARTFVDASVTSFSVDVYSDWANPQGWGVYDNSIKLILNYQGGYQVLDALSGSLTNGAFGTFTFDLSPWAATISAPELSYSQFSIAWRLGTFADNGMENGTQTFAIDNLTVASVPEPSSALLLGFCGMGLVLRRKR